MDEYSSEQEQIDKIKSWWKKNGNSLILGISITLLSVGGFRYWDNLRDKEAREASLNYEQMILMISNGNFSDALSTGETIISAYPKSIYAPLSRLILAKAAADENNLEQAKNFLLPLVEKTNDTQIQNIAASRLARIALAEKKISVARALISTLEKDEGGEKFNELRGDVLVAEEDFSAARAAYLAALEKSENASLRREIILLKLSNLPTHRQDDSS